MLPSDGELSWKYILLYLIIQAKKKLNLTQFRDFLERFFWVGWKGVGGAAMACYPVKIYTFCGVHMSQNLPMIVVVHWVVNKPIQGGLLFETLNF